MALFLSRRTYFAAEHRFTNNLATLTRPVMLRKNAAGQYTGGIISLSDWLDQVAQAAGGGGVVIYVHGFNTSQASMLARLEKIETGLADAGFAGAVVAFDWPSKGNVLAYDQDRNAAKAAAPFLVPEVIEVLAARLPGQDLHLICHSMGCFLTLRALSGKGDQPGADPCLLDQVCFVAADAEAEALHQGAWGALVMARRCSRFTNYYSVADRVLALSGGLIHGGRARAGQVGLPDLTAPNAVDLYTTAQFRRDVPAAEQNDRMVSHNWYYENAGFWEDVKLTLAGQPANQMPTRRPTDQLDQALLT